MRQSTRRRQGRAKGKIWMAADFDRPMPASILRAFASGAFG